MFKDIIDTWWAIVLVDAKGHETIYRRFLGTRLEAEKICKNCLADIRSEGGTARLERW